MVREIVTVGHGDRGEKILRITGKVKVIDAGTLAFEDGTQVFVAGPIDAPALEQMALIGEKFYPWGREAAEFLRKRIGELSGDPDALWNEPLPELKALWDFHAGLDSLCELIASVQFGHEEFFPRTSKSFIDRVTPVDPETAAIYRDTLLADEEGHEWIAPEILRRYATDVAIQDRCLTALRQGCELFGRAIESFNRSMPS